VRRRGANLTRQLLAFARRQVIEPRVVNLNKLIANLNKMLRRLIGEDIKLILQAAPTWPLSRPTRPDRAGVDEPRGQRPGRHADGGTLIIRTGKCYPGPELRDPAPHHPGDYVMISVTDQWPGMTDEVKRHVFEPFFTTKVQGKGTGLGLATCFGIIQQSYGHIHCESQPGKGAEFRIYLPPIRGKKMLPPRRRPRRNSARDRNGPPR